MSIKLFKKPPDSLIRAPGKPYQENTSLIDRVVLNYKVGLSIGAFETFFVSMDLNPCSQIFINLTALQTSLWAERVKNAQPAALARAVYIKMRKYPEKHFIAINKKAPSLIAAKGPLS